MFRRPASCPIIHPWESLLIGAVGALVTIGCDVLLNRLQVDDPVAAVAVHGASGAWVGGTLGKIYKNRADNNSIFSWQPVN
ncbi:ammonium transporter [Elysia marginata]|uniref:Ammonium transporter n=1 Tax=Elysia marginata TaxID=1093978 RepID=A0AAV4IBD8_9GAST|nr:ammonium transporter [Elysia marginata]